MIKEKYELKIRFATDCIVLQIFSGCLCLPFFNLWLPSASSYHYSTVFFRDCLRTFIAAVLRSFLPLLSSAIAGTANSNKSALRRLPLGRRSYAKMELRFSQCLLQVHRLPFHAVVQYLSGSETLLVLKQPPCSVPSVRNEQWNLF